MLACVSFNELLLPTQVHHGSQSGAMPSDSASREASVLELADLDREVRSNSRSMPRAKHAMSLGFGHTHCATHTWVS